MATPLKRLCLQPKSSKHLIATCTSLPRLDASTRQFHTTRYLGKKKAEEGSNRPNPAFGRKVKRVPLKPSEIDVPRATSTRKLLEAFDFNEVKESADNKGFEEYATFLEQYGAAVSPELPPNHAELSRQFGSVEPRQGARATADETQGSSNAGRIARMAKITLRHIEAENPLILEVPGIPPRSSGLVSMDDEGDEYTGPDERFQGDDITSTGHGYLEQHREIREFYRLAAWELPLLTQHAKPFELPAGEAPLRFRTTTYMGDPHPAEKKVVVEFCTADLPLTSRQRRKLVKLLGPRYDPQKDMAKMSCESYAEPSQNKRYLADLIDTLLAEARLESTAEGAKDAFDDIPADFRHVKWKKKPAFPDAWKMTPERREKLFQGWTAEIGRSQQMLLEGSTVNGEKTIAHFLGTQAIPEPQPVKVR